MRKKQWKLEVKNTKIPIKVITNYKSLQYFMSIKKLTKRQVCQAEFLSGFNFVIFYILGKGNDKVNAIIYQPHHSLTNNYDNWQQYLL